MPTYRLYRLTKDNRVIGPAYIFECGTDDEAIEIAKQKAEGRDVEVWQSSRLVAFLTTPKNEPPPAPPKSEPPPA